MCATLSLIISGDLIDALRLAIGLLDTRIQKLRLHLMWVEGDRKPLLSIGGNGVDAPEPAVILVLDLLMALLAVFQILFRETVGLNQCYIVTLLLVNKLNRLLRNVIGRTMRLLQPETKHATIGHFDALVVTHKHRIIAGSDELIVLPSGSHSWFALVDFDAS